MGSETPRRVVVELVGTPGSGKTTVAEATVAGLRQAGVTALTPTDAGRPDAARTRVGRAVVHVSPDAGHVLLWQLHLVRRWGGRCRVVARAPGLVAHVLGSQWRRPVPWRLRRHALVRWFAHAGGRVVTERGAQPGEVLVVDDGFVHRAATLHASEHQRPDPDVVAAYVDRIPRADLLVHVRVPTATCDRRVASRGAWAHRPLDERGRRAFLEHTDAALAVAVERARRNGWAVVEVDNDGRPPGDAAEHVVQHVVERLVDAATGAEVVA